MTKKGHQKLSALKWKFLPKKSHSKTLVREIFFLSPPNSAPSLRLWSWVLKVQQTEARCIAFILGYHTRHFYLIYTNLPTSNKSSLWKVFLSHIPVAYFIRYNISWSLNDPPHPQNLGVATPTHKIDAYVFSALPQFTCRNSVALYRPWLAVIRFVPLLVANS